MKDLKVILIFYCLLLVFTITLSITTAKFESKEDYYQYEKEVALNYFE